MSKICYVERTFSASSLKLIETANEILEDYVAQGYDLTLRQVYYQFVARDLIPNRDTEYKRLGSVINDARLAGLIDWDHITDRTRNLRENGHWNDAPSIVRAVAQQFQHDKWADQPNHVVAMVEKDALVGVLEVACKPLDIGYFSCRGYNSQSEMWAQAMKLVQAHRRGKALHIIHLGDHDPSGIDMTRDIMDRLEMFVIHHVGLDGDEERLVNVHRIALNRDQIDLYNPPPNPAKLTDSRSDGYIAKHGYQSWELDALEPAVLTALITEQVEALRDDDLWDEAVEREDEAKKLLQKVSDQWKNVVKNLD